MAKIGLAHFRVKETDGVSLEMDKWAAVLRKMGHECFFISGNNTSGNLIIEEMHYLDKDNLRIIDACYKNSAGEDVDVRDLIFNTALRIEEKLLKIIDNHKLDIIIPNNIWSLGWHLSAAIAFTRVAKKREDIKFISHNHDFYWERELYSHPKQPYVSDILNQYLLPDFKNIIHCVINNLAKDELKKRKGIESFVINNVFDFDLPFWKTDSYNGDLRKNLNIGAKDKVVLHATRITERKAVELAVLVVGRMQQKMAESGVRSNLFFVLCGLDESPEYFDNLRKLMDKLQIKWLYINNIVGHSRKTEGGHKTYSLFDIYTMADIVTYTSVLEGWGNQLLEAVFAKKPVIMYEYPVYQYDLKRYGLDIVSLGSKYSVGCENMLLSLDGNIAEDAADKALKIMSDKKLYDKTVDNNFEIGRKYFSFSYLHEQLKNILGRL